LAKAADLIALEPGLFLVYIGLTDGSGLDFIPRIKAECQTRALVVTAFGDRETVVSAIRPGADGYWRNRHRERCRPACCQPGPGGKQPFRR
jgi:DNA-binding NarL/FixJ family response regulator